MGTRAAIFAVYSGEEGYFGRQPQINQKETARLAKNLPFRIEGDGMLKELNPWPVSGFAEVGVFEKGALVIHRSLLDECVRAQDHAVTKSLISRFPHGKFLALGLHSVVNCFAYTFMEGGATIRQFGGAEDHIDADQGDLLTEEAPHFERSFLRDGMRYFKSPEGEFDATAYGETLVMGITTRLFGKPLNDPTLDLPRLLYFKLKPWWKIW